MKLLCWFGLHKYLEGSMFVAMGGGTKQVFNCKCCGKQKWKFYEE